MISYPLEIARFPGSPPPWVRIRPICPGDADALRRFYVGLSAAGRQWRFLGTRSGLREAQANHLCAVDHVHADAFVATVGSDGGERIVGYLCHERVESGVEEVAVAVADEWQGKGIGGELYHAALISAESRGIRQLEATLLSYSTRVRCLLSGAGRPYTIESDELGTLYLTIDLSRAA